MNVEKVMDGSLNAMKIGVCLSEMDLQVLYSEEDRERWIKAEPGTPVFCNEQGMYNMSGKGFYVGKVVRNRLDFQTSLWNLEIITDVPPYASKPILVPSQEGAFIAQGPVSSEPVQQTDFIPAFNPVNQAIQKKFEANVGQAMAASFPFVPQLKPGLKEMFLKTYQEQLIDKMMVFEQAPYPRKVKKETKKAPFGEWSVRKILDADES
jgi:hypothetical protein